MADFFSYVSSWSVLQWIVLVLIAGFIGQFGKMAAEAIAGKIHARREKKENLSDLLTKSSASHPSSIIEIPGKNF